MGWNRHTCSHLNMQKLIKLPEVKKARRNQLENKGIRYAHRKHIQNYTVSLLPQTQLTTKNLYISFVEIFII